MAEEVSAETERRVAKAREVAVEIEAAAKR